MNRQKKERYSLLSTFFTLLAIVLIIAQFGTSVRADDEICGNDTVILLHGLGRTERSMATIDRDLTDRGYHVDNIDYPSTNFSISQLSAHYVAPAVARARLRGGRIHFVTHSMGAFWFAITLRPTRQKQLAE